VYDVPIEIDQQVARLKLAGIGILTPDQLAYASSWNSET
jgi:S-adenosylhomocysteine hydrolase